MIEGLAIMSEMVERVRAALEAAAYQTGTDVNFDALARAAIEAMRTPAPALLSVLLREHTQPGIEPYEVVWGRYIDAALEPKQKGPASES